MNMSEAAVDDLPRGPGRRPLDMKTIMAVAFFAGLLVRIVYIVSFHDSPFFDGLIVDAQWHDGWARGWADGTWKMGGRAFFRAPLYPFFLSLIYRLFGRDLLAVRIVQAVVGSGTIAALAGSGWRIGGRKTALWAAVIAALYGPLLFFDAELLIPNLLVALLAWALFFSLGRPSVCNYTIAAVLLGLSVITRPNALVLLPVLCAYIWMRVGAGMVIPRSLLAWFIVLALAPAVVVTAINAREEGAFVFIASQGGVNFYAGNNPQATGRTVIVPEMKHRQTGWSNFVKLSHDVAEEGAGRELDSREVSSFWTGRALDWIRSDPAAAAILTLKKMYYVINAFEVANNRDPYLNTSFPLNVLMWKMPWFAFPWGLVFPLALVGVILGCRNREKRRAACLLCVWLVVYALSLVPFFITARFRMGMVPAAILLAAYATSRGRGLLSPVPLAAGVVGLIFVNTNLFAVRGGNPAQEKAKLGAALLIENRLPESRRMLEEAVAEDPSADYVYLLGQTYFLDGRYEEALGLFRRSIELDPTNYRILYYIGNSLLHVGNYDEAVGALEKSMELNPRDGEVWGSLGRAYERSGDMGRAVAAYSRAVKHDPDNEQWRLDLGYLHQERGDLDAAIEAWREGAKRRPDSFALHFNLAVAYAEAEQYLNALEEIETALSIKPDNQDALRLHTWIMQRIRQIR
jgi:tetratricopeptide (TPR) repeat protein